MSLAGLQPAQAHFTKGSKVRTILVAPAERGLGMTVYVRAPAPLVFSDLIGQSQTQLTPLTSPFLAPEETGTGVRYRLLSNALSQRQDALLERLSRTLSFSQSGLPVTATARAFTVSLTTPASAFDTAESAKEALQQPLPQLDAVFGEAVIDYVIDLPDANQNIGLTVVSGLAPLLPGPGVSIDQHIRDLRHDPAEVLAVPGQLRHPVELNGCAFYKAGLFLYQGVLHILKGLDHVMLVVALALGIGARRRLIWLVTAFTLGHSATLLATFLGATPSWPWFIPAVEMAIAVSVLYAALNALLRKDASIAVFTAIGLLHGLGFSFVLGEILGRDSPGLVTSLVAFNVGIEIGQLIVLAVTLAIMAVLRRISVHAEQPVRLTALAIIACLSCWWVIERGSVLV